jgi:hypothetical protein
LSKGQRGLKVAPRGQVLRIRPECGIKDAGALSFAAHDRTLMPMQLNTEELADLGRRLRLIDAEMESLALQEIPEHQQAFRATLLIQERTSIRQQLVDGS